MRYLALLHTLLFYGPVLGSDVNSPLENCRLQTVSVVNRRLAISALCPNPSEYTEYMALNNSYIFSRLYLDQCYGFNAENSSFDRINKNATDSLHDPEKNITTACWFDTKGLQNMKSDWSGGIQLAGFCNGRVTFTMMNDSLVQDSMHSCGGRLACGEYELAKDEDTSIGAFAASGSCNEYGILHGGTPENHTGAELWASCKPYVDLNHTAWYNYTVIDLADCLARYPASFRGTNSTAEAITKAVKACPTTKIVLDLSTQSLTIDCYPFKNKTIDISAFVRSENGRLACYDVQGRDVTAGEFLEIQGSEMKNGSVKRRQPDTNGWRNGAPWSRI